MHELSSIEFKDVVASKATFILHFWAEWNEYDTEQMRYINEVSKQLNRTAFYQMNIDVESNFEICKSHHVNGPPTIVFYVKGKMVKHMLGIMSVKTLLAEAHKLNFV